MVFFPGSPSHTEFNFFILPTQRVRASSLLLITLDKITWKDNLHLGLVLTPAECIFTKSAILSTVLIIEADADDISTPSSTHTQFFLKSVKFVKHKVVEFILQRHLLFQNLFR